MASPLEGIKVLELIRVAPGAFCTMMLADMGAEVLKIETPPIETAMDTETASRRAAFSFVNRNSTASL
jgi:crotonobetainyl-CoA:carnitine CoA-transferase CaiB-like acyl-CoA transferase